MRYSFQNYTLRKLFFFVAAATLTIPKSIRNVAATIKIAKNLAIRFGIYFFYFFQNITHYEQVFYIIIYFFVLVISFVLLILYLQNPG